MKIVQNRINRNSKKIFLLNQVHSSKFIFIDKNFNLDKKKLNADAIITNQKNLPIGVLTADCVPLLLCDNKKKIVAAIHVGWKGALSEIVKNVVSFMFLKGCKINDITAVIGPSIKQKSYNVKEDFQKKFINKNKKNKIYFKKKKDIIFFDLPNYVKSQLKLNEITNIDMINIDTFDEKNNFFSSRRSLRLKHDDYGRNISIIMIN